MLRFENGFSWRNVVMLPPWTGIPTKPVAANGIPSHAATTRVGASDLIEWAVPVADKFMRVCNRYLARLR